MLPRNELKPEGVFFGLVTAAQVDEVDKFFFVALTFQSAARPLPTVSTFLRAAGTIAEETGASKANQQQGGRFRDRLGGPPAVLHVVDLPVARVRADSDR